jgi:hypothetical protein
LYFRTTDLVKASEELATVVGAQAENFERVNGFLQFAEAKNGAGLVVAAGLAAMVYDQAHAGSDIATWPLLEVLIFLMAALIYAVSFLPRLQPTKILGGSPSTEKNLLYFGHIAEIPSLEFASKFRAGYFENAKFGETFYDDLSTQVSVNSRICLRKMKLFTVGSVLVSLGALSVIARVLCTIVSNFGGLCGICL